MANEVELASLDLRYEGFRLQQPALQERLLSSIAQRGIEEPLEGVDLSAACPSDREGQGGLQEVSRRYVMWNILGIVDLVVAVSLGAICSGFIPGLTGKVTTGAMAQLPSVLIPAYLVPIFIMLHVACLAQSRQLARSGKHAHA